MPVQLTPRQYKVNYGEFYGIGPNGNNSGWVVPEPASLGLLALAATTLVRRRLR